MAQIAWTFRQTLKAPVPQGQAADPDNGGTVLDTKFSGFPGTFGLPLFGRLMSTSSVTGIAVERHPRSVSSGCHNCPGDGSDLCAPVSSVQSEDNLDAIFRTHMPSLVSYFRRRVGSDEAADLVQDVFVRAAGSKERHKLLNPGGFLRRIAQNLLIDRTRKRVRNNVILFPLMNDHEAATPPEQEFGLEAQDLMRIYEGAVDAMPPKTRNVFLMHRVDELSYRQIHERLGISIATVEYHMMKALAHISKAVDDSE